MEDTTELVTRKQKRMWDDFLKWLIKKTISTNVDFKPEAWRWKISVDGKWFTMREDKRNIKSYAISKDGKHSETDEVPDKIELHGIIGRLSRQMTLNVHGMKSEI